MVWVIDHNTLKLKVLYFYKNVNTFGMLSWKNCSLRLKLGLCISMTNIKDVLAANLKQFRRARGWSQAYLAEKVETSTNYIGMLENSAKFPSSGMVHKLAYALGIDPTDLFSRGIDPVSTMKKYQKAALEDIHVLLGRLINEKIQQLEEKPPKCD